MDRAKIFLKSSSFRGYSIGSSLFCERESIESIYVWVIIDRGLPPFEVYITRPKSPRPAGTFPSQLRDVSSKALDEDSDEEIEEVSACWESIHGILAFHGRTSMMPEKKQVVKVIPHSKTPTGQWSVLYDMFWDYVIIYS